VAISFKVFFLICLIPRWPCLNESVRERKLEFVGEVESSLLVLEKTSIGLSSNPIFLCDFPVSGVDGDIVGLRNGGKC